MFFIVLPPYSGKQFLSGPHRARARWRTAQAFFYSPGLQPFIPAEFVRLRRNKSRVRWFNLMWMPGAGRQSESFEELAMPLFDQLYNFAHWLTQDREEAEDLVQETYAKALRGFSSFQLGTNFRAWMYRILRNTFLTSRTGLRATATVPLD